MLKKRGLREFFRIRESDKHFLLAVLVVTGIVFFWRGAWGIMDHTPIISDYFVSIFIGLVIMTFSGVIYREFIPEEEPLTPILDALKDIFKHPVEKRKAYVIKYYDEIAKIMKEITHAHIKQIERNFLVMEKNGEEYFIPIHRIKKIHKEGEVIWEAEKKKIRKI